LIAIRQQDRVPSGSLLRWLLAAVLLCLVAVPAGAAWLAGDSPAGTVAAISAPDVGVDSDSDLSIDPEEPAGILLAESATTLCARARIPLQSPAEFAAQAPPYSLPLTRAPPQPLS